MPKEGSRTPKDERILEIMCLPTEFKWLVITTGDVLKTYAMIRFQLRPTVKSALPT